MPHPCTGWIENCDVEVHAQGLGAIFLFVYPGTLIHPGHSYPHSVVRTVDEDFLTDIAVGRPILLIQGSKFIVFALVVKLGSAVICT